MSETRPERGSLPLASLRLIIPPLQLVSAALWEIVKQGEVMNYGVLEEFVTTVLDSVPELLTYTERVQLVMGLRARVVLELCRSNEFASPETIQPHIARMNNYITQQCKEDCISEVKTSVANFFHLVHTLVHDPCQRDAFYQKVFLSVFGPKYDSALQALMRKFLFSLQKLIPVPNLDQTADWLGLAPSVLNECVEFVNQPEPLNTLIQHHKHHGPAVQQALSSLGDTCILSCLAYHIQKVDNERQEDKPPSMWVQEVWISSECKQEKEEIEVMKTELKYIEEINRQQHVSDLTENQVASVEVELPLDDDFVSEESGKRTSSKSFKCAVCGRSFGSLGKLKRHKMPGNKCSIRRAGTKQRQSDLNNPRSRSSFPERKTIMAHKETNDCNINEREVSPLPPATQLKPSNSNSELSTEDQSLICQICSKVFTYTKSFNEHRRRCVFRHRRKRQGDAQCSTSVSDNAKPKPDEDDDSKEFKISNVAPQESLSSSSEEKMCIRSSSVETCSVCGDVFTSASELSTHMRVHTKPDPHLCSSCGEDFEQYEDYERHRKGQCRGSIQQPRAKVRSTPRRKKHKCYVPAHVRKDGIDHSPKWGRRQRCKHCPGNYFSRIYCSKCKVHLCFNRSRNCFVAFHKASNDEAYVGTPLTSAGKDKIECGRPPSSPEPDSAPPSKSCRRRCRVPAHVRKDGIDHFPTWGIRQRCKHCTGNHFSLVYCGKCKVHLCLNRQRNCFHAYHKVK
ncbi:uncharacterized protein LOC142994351 isoform X1 [Genypterus blacodes]|uniref:uncharacterized protein LOC142994351 isoform X1 n=1 Tax=Genypterus blacodes TaxID=154954 RepID=UPI003F7703F9